MTHELAEGEGFEPSMDCKPILVFETSAFNHSATPPRRRDHGRAGVMQAM